MRFLNTTSLKFEEIPEFELDLEENQYAILSHRWGADEDEVSYNDMKDVDYACGKKGFAKIRGFCDLAASLGCRYGWVDTCCINKGNSSELAEAINSMYLWYKSSTFCIVYLEDVPQTSLIDSEWFDRGWTLQELIAPQSVSFFDHQWIPLGTKIDLLGELSNKTRVPIDVLSHTIQPATCSVAQRMSWAANRKTKRIEDRAYSLMGLFDIHMPMIYGEREGAFLRLQQHIVQKSKDESIFAWAMEPQTLNPKTYTGLYAPSPSVYEGCGNIIQTMGSRGFSERNGELSIHLTLSPHSPGIFSALLHCMNGPFTGDNRVSIFLAKTSAKDEYVRIRDSQGTSRIMTQSAPVQRNKEELIQVSANPSSPPRLILYGFKLRSLHPPGHLESNISILSNCPTPEPKLICQENKNQGNSGIVHIQPKCGESEDWLQLSWIKFGFTRHCQPIIWLGNKCHTPRLQYPFEQAFSSHKMGSHSPVHEQVMKADSVLERTEMLERVKNLRYGWPEGQALVEFPDFKCPKISIPELRVKILVRLLNYNGTALSLRGGVDGSGLPLNPMLVWTVDIVELKEEVVHSPKSSSSSIAKCRRQLYWILHLPLMPFQIYEDKKRAEQAKRDYHRTSSSRIPYFIVS